jgi:hypothetical protein
MSLAMAYMPQAPSLQKIHDPQKKTRTPENFGFGGAAWQPRIDGAPATAPVAAISAASRMRSRRV